MDNKDFKVLDYMSCPKPLYKAKQGNFYGFVNHNFEVVVPFVYDYADTFFDGIALVGISGLYGAVDSTGKQIIPCQYSFIVYTRDLLRVEQNGKWGCLDMQGKVIIPCIYDQMSGFVNGTADVVIDGVEGVIGVNGKAYFGKERKQVAKEYLQNIDNRKSLIKEMIKNAINEEEVMHILQDGKKHINHLRTQMESKVRKLDSSKDTQSIKRLNECKTRAKESIELF